MLTLRKSTLIAALFAAAPLAQAADSITWIQHQLSLSEASGGYTHSMPMEAEGARGASADSAKSTQSGTGTSATFEFIQRQLRLTDDGSSIGDMPGHGTARGSSKAEARGSGAYGGGS